MEQGIASPARQRWQIVLAQALSSPREQSINTGSWGSLSSIYALGRITCAAAGDAGAAEAAHTGRTWLRAGERTRLGSARSDGTSARDERSDRRGLRTHTTPRPQLPQSHLTYVICTGIFIFYAIPRTS